MDEQGHEREKTLARMDSQCRPITSRTAPTVDADAIVAGMRAANSVLHEVLFGGPRVMGEKPVIERQALLGGEK